MCLPVSLSLVVAGCSKEVQRYEAMVRYHAESLQLPFVPVDSVQRFSHKVDAFVALHPAAAEDPLYPAIQQHIDQAMQRFTITADPEWEGVYHYGNF